MYPKEDIMSKKWFFATTILSVVIITTFLIIPSKTNLAKTFNILKKLSPTPLLNAGRESNVKNFVLSGNIPDVKPNVKVYKVKKINAKDKALKLASIFNVAIENEKQLNDEYSVSNKSCAIIVSENGGGFIFHKEIEPSREGSLPSKEESIKIAQDYLTKVGLFNPEMKVSGFDEEVVEYSDGRKEIENRNIYFQHQLDNIRISSGVTRVQIGKNGVIEIVSENKKELEEISTYPIISPSEAIKAANEGNAVYAGDKEVAETGYITNVELVYMDNGPLSTTYQQYHPVYILSGKLDSLDSNDHFKLQVRALNPSAFSTDETNTYNIN